ncbi:hypothetical protein IDH44_21155 [Paenibacillus sp. IB182496]|uniref:Uncharacterized protein n=1 Tax=Paenibacillus sabuli TaxID=2772509 RepID=A0A927BVP7_9BACL|nr:hypothetical protein [Paenibacillus sabuli]
MEVEIDLYRDWLATAREVVLASGAAVPGEQEHEALSRAYYALSSADEAQAIVRAQANAARVAKLQQTLLDNLETVILPDIRSRTGYAGDRLRFRWVYAQEEEHIVEELSEYRIPLGPTPV